MHFASIGAFEPLLFIDGEWCSSGKFTNDAFEQEYFIPTKYSRTQSDILIYQNSIGDGLFESDLCNIDIRKLPSEDDYPLDLFEIYVCGYMAFSFLSGRLGFFNTLETNGTASLSNSFLFPSHTGKLLEDISDDKKFLEKIINHMYISFISKSITISDIYISHEELLILQAGGRKNTEKAELRDLPPTRKDIISTDDARSKCAEFIRDILYLCYKNDELRDKPWLLVRDDKTKGEPTEFERDFKNLRLSMPSRKSIKRWTEQK
ncbi:hypothetical protein [Providencia stuartii]|uniref:hypothetical protein n=1 Tax=Providencia stuartii TaxID=588 RepID=UPI000CE67D7A|nr:hypothetical protein AM353_10910 [Providencia stuartii]